MAAFIGEEVDDPVDGLVGTVGMQRREAEMPGFGEGDGVVHGRAIADFTHHDHVRCLPQRVLQRDFPTVGINTDLALGDDAFLVLVDELDRVFDGDDVTLTIAVAVINECRQRGGLAGAGTPDKNDQAAQGHRDVFQYRRQAELVEGRYDQVDGAADDGDLALLYQSADTEAADSRRRDGEVAFLCGFEIGGLPIVHDRTREFSGVLRQQWLVGNRYHLAVDLDRRREVCRDEEVRTVFLRHQSQQFVHEF